jgi:hypothetical protein
MTADDVEALKTQLAGVRAVAPVAQKSFTVIYGGENRVTVVSGTDLDYFVTQDWMLASGRQFLEGEIRGGRAACILGQTVREKLFGRSDPIGQTIRVKNVSCEVIGLLEPKGQSSTGTDQDDLVILPLRAYHRRLAGNTDVGSINISARDGVDTAKVQADIERLLRERRSLQRGQEDDFSVRDMKQLAQTTAGTTAMLTGLLGGCGGQLARRRHRHHEHHAGLGDGAHEGNRHPAGDRRAGKPSSAPVPRGGHCVVPFRRIGRRASGARPRLAGHRRSAGAVLDRSSDRSDRLRLLRLCWCRFRLLPRAPSSATGSDRGVTARVS